MKTENLIQTLSNLTKEDYLKLAIILFIAFMITLCILAANGNIYIECDGDIKLKF